MSGSDSEVDDAATHAASMKRLQAKDPDFYEFLKENDKDLLQFGASDEEDSEDEQEDVQDTEDEEEDISTGIISSQKLQYIKEHIRTSPSIKLCKELIRAFKTAVHQAEGSDVKNSMSNSELFNDIVKLCLIDLVPALLNVMKLSTGESKKKIDPAKSKVWKRVQTCIKGYLIDMMKLFSVMNDPTILTLLLKHTIHLVPFYCVFIKLCRHLVKKMISFWSSDEETVRVLSLVIIVRATKSFSKYDLSQILKVMYFAYIKNTKFTSPTTWPMINFMKRSLTEVYTLNPELAYEHGFVYIRQMSIHLRNALTTKKKESFQTVYNWQYTHCILLWCHLLCRLHEHDAIKTLIYPLVQITIGTINLIPTAKYIPLRVHLVKGLMHITESTNIFIPVLPFILDILKVVDYNKKSNFSVKPVDFSCSLKVTKSQLHEAGFKDACVAEVCSMLVDYLKIYSSSIGFPELALPTVMQIKSFIKQSKVSKYNQQLKTVLSKIEENNQLVSEKRRMVTFPITDAEQIKKWEEALHSQGTPMQRMKKDLVKITKADDESDMPPKKKKKQK